MSAIMSWLHPKPELSWYQRWLSKFPDPDPRSDVWFLGPLNPIVVIPMYIMGIFYFIPRLAPKEIDVDKVKSVLRIYNIVFICMNGIYAVWVLMIIIAANYSWICQPCEVNGDWESQLALSAWLYMCLKLVEFADTFMLKLGNARAFLAGQVYHHTTVYFFAWLCVRYVPTGSSVFYLMLNSITHVILYTLYKLTDYELEPIVYTTTSTQFVLIIIHSLINIYVDCGYPVAASWMILLYMLSFLGMYTWIVFAH